MEVNVLRIAVTVLSFISFVGIWWWAWKGTNQLRLAELSRVCIGLEDTPCPYIEEDSGERGGRQGNVIGIRSRGVVHD